MMFRNAAAVLTTTLMLTSDVAASGNKCFCPVDGPVDTTGGKCHHSNGNGEEYRSLSTHPYFAERNAAGGMAKCRESCAEEPGTCKGYAWRADIEFDPSRAQDANVQGKNCYLYDYVPDRVLSDFTDWSCFGMSGVADGTYTLFPPGKKYNGGKCIAPVYSGTGYTEKTNADSLDECKDWCDGRGNLCEGFDFDEGKTKYGGVSCWERRYKPTGARAPTSRKDYTDWFCHAKNCNCDQTVSTKLCTPMWNLIDNDEVCVDTNDVCEATANLGENGQESCNAWCERSGLVCTQAWNDGKNYCEKKSSIGCDKTGKKKSICHCEKPEH